MNRWNNQPQDVSRIYEKIWNKRHYEIIMIYKQYITVKKYLLKAKQFLIKKNIIDSNNYRNISKLLNNLKEELVL